VLAATHQPLEQLVEQRIFRADLFYRLNVFPIYLPPLRERRDDMPSLVHEILSQLTRRLGCRMPLLEAGDLSLLQSHQWPGNIRELENTLERSLILSSDDPARFSQSLSMSVPSLTSRSARRSAVSWDAPTLRVAKAPAPAALKAPAPRGSEPEAPLASSSAPSGPPGAPDQLDTFEDAVRRSIEQALIQSNGQIYGEAGAAKILNLKPSTLQSKMKKLGISRKAFRA